MPNWIMNELVVYNLDSTGKTTLEKTFGSNEPFQTICPMPKVLEDTQAPTPSSLNKILGASFSEQEWRRIILEQGVEKVIRRIHKDKTIDEYDANKAELAVNAIVETGYSNWYDWCVDNWGVKWDADEICLQDETLFTDDEKSEPNLMVSFLTPWGPPTGILEKLSERYPNARFYLRWADQFGPGNGIGFFVAEAGVIDERKIEDEEEFFNKLWESEDYEDD